MTTPLQPQVTHIVPGVTSDTPTVSHQNAPYYVPSATTTTLLQPETRYFTEADLERARQQEKDKLYERLEKTNAQLNEFKKTVEELAADKKTRDDELARQQQAARDEAARLENEKLSVQQLMEKQRSEFEAEQNKLRADMELRLTLAAKEQELLQLKSYIQRRVNEEINATTIIPDLAEYITGDNEEQVEASIQKAKDKTAAIVQAAMGTSMPSIPMGTSPTGAPFSPLDRLSGPREYTAQEIAAMPVSSPEYQAYRRAKGLDRAGTGRGLF